MKGLISYLGVIIILVGVGIFMYYHFVVAATGANNTYLYAGSSCVILGAVLYYFLNKYLK